MADDESNENDRKSGGKNLNVKFGRLLYFVGFLIISFTWNITAVVDGGKLVEDHADLKESYHEAFLTLMMIFGILVALPQLIK